VEAALVDQRFAAAAWADLELSFARHPSRAHRAATWMVCRETFGHGIELDPRSGPE
jgi:hypothetical protein